MDMSSPVFRLYQKMKSQPKFKATAELVSFPPVNNILTLACERYGTSLLCCSLEKKWGSFQTHDTVLTSWPYQVSLLAASGLMTCCIHSAHRSVITCPSSQQLLDFITIKKKSYSVAHFFESEYTIFNNCTALFYVVNLPCTVTYFLLLFFKKHFPNEGQ